MEPVVLEVALRPGLPALLGVVAVLHARHASVRTLAYEWGSLLITVDGSVTDADRLRAQIDRRVDVLSSTVTPRIEAVSA